MAVLRGETVASQLQQAKRPVTPLAGPYGHPFHPILVTVPIGAWVMSLVFDLVSRWSGEPEVFVKAAYWLIVGGLIAAAVAAVFGLLDLFAIPRRTRAFKVGLAHLVLNVVVLALFAGSVAARIDHLDEGDSTTTGVVLSAVALGLLAVSGWLGGMLAYHYGVRVADEAEQASGYGDIRGEHWPAGT
jgi:uncharacterized membrane protein